MVRKQRLTIVILCILLCLAISLFSVAIIMHDYYYGVMFIGALAGYFIAVLFPIMFVSFIFDYITNDNNITFHDYPKSKVVYNAQYSLRNKKILLKFISKFNDIIVNIIVLKTKCIVCIKTETDLCVFTTYEDCADINLLTSDNKRNYTLLTCEYDDMLLAINNAQSLQELQLYARSLSV